MSNAVLGPDLLILEDKVRINKLKCKCALKYILNTIYYYFGGDGISTITTITNNNNNPVLCFNVLTQQLRKPITESVGMNK
jgi:hypothetical protein